MLHLDNLQIFIRCEVGVVAARPCVGSMLNQRSPHSDWKYSDISRELEEI